MNILLKATIWVAASIAAFTFSSAHAQVKPFLPPQPIEGETRAYSQLLETVSIKDDQARILRSLNLARDMTAGPTKLRAYIDCMRIGPLVSANKGKLALIAADECFTSYPSHPFPLFLRAMARMHSYGDSKLLNAGVDDLITVLTENPSMHQLLSFDDLASQMRGLTAAGDEERKAALVKAYFNPLYVPAPNPKSRSSLISGIGVLLDSGETALASRLAGFLQDEGDVIGLLSFKPAEPIWPALEVRHSQGYEASRQAWELMGAKIDEYGLQRVEFLSALRSWDELEEESMTAISSWDGEDGDAELVVAVNKATGHLWNDGLRDESLALSRTLLSKANPNTYGQVSNAAFNAGFRMIESGLADEGKSLIIKHIKDTENNPDKIEWRSGSAFLDALRVCAYEGSPAKQALRKLEQAKSKLFSQKIIAYSCLRNANAISQLRADRLDNGAMSDRLDLAIKLAHSLKNPDRESSSTQAKARNIEPFKSAISRNMRIYPEKND